MPQNTLSVDAVTGMDSASCSHGGPGDTIQVRLLPAPKSSDIFMRVPPEIFHCVFHLLRHDRQTLLSCALVSQYYRKLSMPWLFAHITVRSAERLVRFIEFINAHSDLGSYVKQLDFYGYNGFLEPFVSHSQPEILAILSTVVSTLPSIRSLSLGCISLDPEPSLDSTFSPGDIETSDAKSKSHLSKLCLSCGSIASWTPILLWLLSRYTVDVLQLYDLRLFRIGESKALDRLRSSLHIPSVVVHVACNERNDPYSLLHTLLQPGCLQSASMLCINLSCATYILHFMHTVGRNVTHVSFDIAYLSVQDEKDQARCWMILGETLGCCPRLKTLRIRMSAFSVADYSGLLRHAVFMAIVPCAPRTLHTLTLGLVEEPPWNSEFGDFEIWDLDALAKYLTREPTEFPSLRVVDVELRLPKPNENEELAEILLPELSTLKDAGVLHVFCDKMDQSARTAWGIDSLPELD